MTKNMLVLKDEFEDESTSDERRIEILKIVQGEAEIHTPEKKCYDGEVVFFVQWHKALIPGHIYSKDGLKEYQISKHCEYHFDELTFDPDDDPYGDDGPPMPIIVELS
jgi:hypothetical protein